MWWNYLSILKLQRLHRWSLWIHKQSHHKLYNECNYLSMLGLKLIHVFKRDHRIPSQGQSDYSPVNHSCRIWLHKSHKILEVDYITTSTHSTTKPKAHFVGYVEDVDRTHQGMMVLTPGLYSLRGRTSCRKISWSLEVALLCYNDRIAQSFDRHLGSY